MSGLLAILVPCARLALRENNAYQTFLDVAEKYWTGWILIAVFFLILLGRLCYAPFLIYRQVEDQRVKLQKELDSRIESEAKERRQARENMYEECAKVLKNSNVPSSFHAIQIVKAFKLELPGELDQLCEELAPHYGHPFEGMDSYVPKRDRLAFLRWICFNPQYDPPNGMAYLNAAEQWRDLHYYPPPPEKVRLVHVMSKTIDWPIPTNS